MPEPAIQSLRELAEAFDAIREQVGGRGEDIMRAITQVAVEQLPGAEWASITQLQNGDFRTTVSTDQRAVRGDHIQYELRSGPCVDAVLEGSAVVIEDALDEPRWSEFGRRAGDELGVRSMLSFRLNVQDDRAICGLNLYARKPAAFKDLELDLGLLLATHGALAVMADNNARRADELSQALQSNREIGIAIGVLMSQQKVTRDQAFDLLRIASQHTHRKLHDIAADVADTGVFEMPPTKNARPRAGG